MSFKPDTKCIYSICEKYGNITRNDQLKLQVECMYVKKTNEKDIYLKEKRERERERVRERDREGDVRKMESY